MRAVIFISISLYFYYLCNNKNMNEISTKQEKEKSIIKFYQSQFELKNV